jgi:hypothetical protein
MLNDQFQFEERCCSLKTLAAQQHQSRTNLEQHSDWLTEPAFTQPAELYHRGAECNLANNTIKTLATVAGFLDH